MQIQKIIFKNWRSVQKETIFLEKLMVFVGKNNHGKSNILRGIEFFFRQKNAAKKDFWKNSDTLSLELTFHLLNEKEKKQWKEYINKEGKLVIQKKQKKGEEAKYSATFSSPHPPCQGRTSSPIINPEDVQNIFHVLRLSFSKKSSSHNVLQALFIEMISRLSHNNRSIFRKNLSIAAKEWGIDMEFSYNGGIENKTLTILEKEQNGLLRALFFSLFYSFSRLESTQKGNKKVLFLWEEPELFLHPQAQSELYFCLKRCLKSNMNIFLTTHSSSFVDITCHKSICIVYKENEEIGTKGKQVRGNLLSKDERKSFNMGYWINPDRGELFFAKKVILVEGPTEKILLPKLAKELGISHYETAIIDCAGKTNMPLYITLLNAFALPYVVVYDLDLHSYKKKNAKEEAKRQSKFLKKKVKKGLGKAIAMKNDIEDELGITEKRKRKKPFLAIHFLERKGFQVSQELKQKMREIFE